MRRRSHHIHAPRVCDVISDAFRAIHLQNRRPSSCWRARQERLDEAARSSRGIEKQDAARFAASVLPGMRHAAAAVGEEESMDALSADEILVFEGFRLDHRAGGLFRADANGVLVPVTIGSLRSICWSSW
jgi:hypothetical protein